MKRKVFIFLQLLFVSMFFLSISSCKKTAGYGGNSTITGKLKVKVYSRDFSIFKEENYVPNTYVYLIFGSDPSYGTRVKTSYDGTFMFEHLQVGNYTVYAYSKDTTLNTASDIAITKDITISKNKSLTDAGEIIIYDNNPTGYSTISGKVKMNDTQNGTTYYISDQKVFIIYDNETQYRKYIRTNYNGEFEFTGLPIGHYQVYVYSKDINNTSSNPYIPVTADVDITTIHQDTVIQDLVIYK